ncbi:MAG: arginine--tRNA ligase [Flavobacteriaceae bacterium]
MENIEKHLQELVSAYIADWYDLTITTFEFQQTRKEFKGDITLVTFPLLKPLKQAPEALGQAIGVYLKGKSVFVTDFNVIKGFLNLVLSDAYFIRFLNAIASTSSFGHRPITEKAPLYLIEYSSPNTNKPLHLGHIRNNVLGHAVANILEAAGNRVHKTQIINDRGIHICKSMVAWINYGEERTPESTGIKGDQLVGNYYVRFDQVYKEQIAAGLAAGKTEEQARTEAPIFVQAQTLLRQWEAGDPTVRALWKKMNQWVYDGFEKTYAALGVDFDSFYYESNTYLLGKSIIDEGLEKKLFYTKDDGSVWVDLTDEGLDEKLLLRADGTAVYMTQDLGTASQRYKDHPSMKGMVYTVGNEQDYHFKVLFLILKKLGYDWAQSLYHLSYGMVDLPSGKMKSREGTVVDADDLIDQMTQTAAQLAKTHGKVEGLSQSEQAKLYHQIGLGALKYFILKVDPKKRILFDPEASVDFNGNTGPFIQYTHARIQSILRKTPSIEKVLDETVPLEEREKAILSLLMQYPNMVKQAAEQYSPAVIANYLYDLVRAFNSFYQNTPILGVPPQSVQDFRVLMTQKVGETIKNAALLLGIHAPDQM